jgi:hypothetical protein
MKDPMPSSAVTINAMESPDTPLLPSDCKAREVPCNAPIVVSDELAGMKSERAV